MQSRSFKLGDVVVLATVCVVLVSLMITGCGESEKDRARVIAQRMQNGTQVRGIQQGFVLFSQSNNGFYPAYTVEGKSDFGAVATGPKKTGAGALTDDDISKVYAIMITGDFFTTDYMISPLDDLTPAIINGYQGTITPANYSYALLDMNDDDSNRRSEWKDTNNSQAPIVADPSSDIRKLNTITYHSDKSASGGNSDTDYTGNVAWNDNHVTFEKAGLYQPGTLKMGSQANEKALNPFKNTANDGAKMIW